MSEYNSQSWVLLPDLCVSSQVSDGHTEYSNFSLSLGKLALHHLNITGLPEQDILEGVLNLIF